jgi:hypothetical protein
MPMYQATPFADTVLRPMDETLGGTLLWMSAELLWRLLHRTSKGRKA